MWEDHDDGIEDPIARSLASSLRATFDGQIDDWTAMVCAQAVRGMVRGLVDWASQSSDHDRSELEPQFDLLARALLDGLGRTLGKNAHGRNAAPSHRGPRRTRVDRRK